MYVFQVPLYDGEYLRDHGLYMALNNVYTYNKSVSFLRCSHGSVTRGNRYGPSNRSSLEFISYRNGMWNRKSLVNMYFVFSDHDKKIFASTRI